MRHRSVIINARIFNGKKFLKENSLFTEADKIASIKLLTNKSAIPRGTHVIDIKNRILCPGLIDIHTHGAAGVSAGSGRNTEKMAIAMAKTGVTSYLAAFFFDGNTERPDVLPAVIKAGARCLGTYLEGPFINPKKRGMIPQRYIWSGGSTPIKLAAKILKLNPFLRIMTIAPEIKGAPGLAAFLIKNNITPAFGHSAADYTTTKAAIKSGIKHVTHLFNAMENFQHRVPGPFPAIAQSKNVTVELIADGRHIHPAAVRLAVATMGAQRIILITDSAPLAGCKAGRYLFPGNGAITVKNGAAYYDDGTLTGSCTSLLKMAGNVKKWCNVSMESALKMATYNPAKLLGFPGVGRIAPGYFADLIVIDNSFKLFYVFTGGTAVKIKHRKTG
jgi:N-acetylglucosamine-6-phosphate deacetylase